MFQLLIRLPFLIGLIYYLWIQLNELATEYQENKETLETYLQFVLNNVVSQTDYSKVQERYNETTINIIDNPTYCIQSDTYKLLHPDVIMKDQYIFRDLENENLEREIVKQQAFDTMNVPKNIEPKYTKKYEHKMPNQLTFFYTNLNRFDIYYKIGESMGCLFQKFNHIPGIHSISTKNALIDNFANYIKKLKNRRATNECLKNASFIPTTFRLNDQEECLDFFNEIVNFEFYEKTQKQGPQYIMKRDIHRGQGITLLSLEEIDEFLVKYKRGEQCGKLTNRIVAQRYVNNPFLYKNHKIEFRIYIYIASTRPLILYSYDQALIKRCASEFDPNSAVKSSHICNTAIVKQVLNSTQQSEDQIESEEYFIDWRLQGVQEQLLKSGRINNSNWLKNYLYPRIHRALIHLIKSGQHTFTQDYRFSEFLGVDFMMDDDLEVWVLEINSNPQILAVTEDRVIRNHKMISDVFDISFAYLRSRYIRFQKFIKNHIAPYFINHPKAKQKHFDEEFQMVIKKLMVDKLENTISISENNGFQKVIDENLQGTAAYNDLLQYNCMI